MAAQPSCQYTNACAVERWKGCALACRRHVWHANRLRPFKQCMHPQVSRLQAAAALMAGSIEAKHEARLRALLKAPANARCFVCSQRGPTFAQSSAGVFVCLDCSGKMVRDDHASRSSATSAQLSTAAAPCRWHAACGSRAWEWCSQLP